MTVTNNTTLKTCTLLALTAVADNPRWYRAILKAAKWLRDGNTPRTLPNGHYVVKACADRAGLGDQVSPHWLRHAHAIAALQRGQPLKTVSETLGHVDLAITGQYLHLLPGESSALAFEEEESEKAKGDTDNEDTDNVEVD